MTLDNILDEIKKAETIVILTHESTDGDAIGSSLAMKFALKKIGKKADVIIPKFARCFEFLPGANDIKKESKIENYDLAISLDCADLKRLVGANPYFENAKSKIVIDHHGSNQMYGDFNFVNPVAPACCQILVGIFDYFGIDIDVEIGTCILAGIITDTGGFQYSSVTPETFEFAADLLRKGVNVSDIYKRVQDTVTRPNFELKKRVLDRMEFFEDGKIAFTYTTIQDEEDVHSETGDHEGLVDIGRSVEGVEVSVFIKQKKDTDGFKISMRSNNYVNVSDVCLMFGGGGHQRAAGAFCSGDVNTIKSKIIAEIKKVLK